MKKVSFLVVALALMSINALAYTQINFQTDVADGSGGNPAYDALFNHLSSPLSAGSLFLVYYSADNVRGFNNVDPYTPIGGDEYIGAYSTGLYQGEVTGNNAVELGASGTYGYQGYVYVAIFEISYSGGAAPSISGGSYYGLGNTMATTDFQQYFDDNGMVPLPANYGTARLETAPVTTSLQVVPEPSTIGLLLVGAGLVAFRRMRRG